MVVKVTGPLSFWWNFSRELLVCQKQILGYAFSKKAYPWIRFFQKSISLDTLFQKKHIPGYAFSKKAYPSCFWRLSGIPEKHIPGYAFSKKAYPWIRVFQKSVSLDTLFPKKRIPRVFRGFLASQKSISTQTLPPQEHIHSRKGKHSFSIFSEHIQVYIYMLPYLYDDPNWLCNMFS